MSLIRLLSAVAFAVCVVSGIHAQAPQMNDAAAPPAAAPPAQPAPAAAPPPQSTAATAAADRKRNWKRRDDCSDYSNVQGEVVGTQQDRGGQLVSPTYFLPDAGQAQLVLQTGFDAHKYFFGWIDWREDQSEKPTPQNMTQLKRGEISTHPIPTTDPVLTKIATDSGNTLVTITMPPSPNWLWRTATIYVFACKDGSPDQVSGIKIPVSSRRFDFTLVISFLAILYVLAAFAARAVDDGDIPWYRYLDPVYMTAGSDGKGSLSKLQILFFSIIVAGLLTYVVARTGILSNISENILWLMGIAGVGSALAKGTDTKVNRLDPDNAAWLVQKHWLHIGGIAATNTASWNDLITSDGEFDVYRFQTCIFSVVVGFSLLAGGINDLASFEIPTNLLGILGLSQVVYIGGKLVTPTSLADLNTAITELRTLEKAGADAAIASTQAAAGGDAAAAASRKGVADQARRAYQEKEARVAILFEQATGRSLPADAIRIEPDLRLAPA
jgi:hypothetical protein